MEEGKRWKSRKKAYQDALNYLHKRRIGSIKSLRTPWKKINSAGVDGFEFHSCVCFAGRPAVGKSMFKDQLVRESFTLNPDINFRVLEFDLEMVPQVTVIREFSSILGKTYNYMCSAEGDELGGKLTQEELQQCFEHAKRKLAKEGDLDKYPIDIIEDAPTVLEFEDIVKDYMETHKIGDVYTPVLITVDHARLFIKAPFESNKTEMLENLGGAIVRLKKKYPIVFFILNHLNREIDKPERNDNGKHGNYILESDILGSDALQQCSEIVIGANRPGKQNISFYGPSRFCIQKESGDIDDTILVFHFLKVRNGATRISFFRAIFQEMRIAEMDTPRTASEKLRTISPQQRKDKENEFIPQQKPLQPNTLFNQAQ